MAGSVMIPSGPTASRGTGTRTHAPSTATAPTYLQHHGEVLLGARAAAAYRDVDPADGLP